MPITMETSLMKGLMMYSGPGHGDSDKTEEEETAFNTKPFAHKSLPVNV